MKSNIFSELRTFLILWLSQSASSLGTAMTEYALTVWVYTQKGTAMSITMLTLCTFLPTIILRFVAGALADRWDKKCIMLCADAFAACGTTAIFILHTFSALEIWHLYVINFLLSCMNAFQIPAAYVATSILVPEKHYTRTGGMQSASGAIISIAAPALGSVVYALSGLGAVLVIDLVTFAIAFGSLLLFIRLPKIPVPAKKDESFILDCLSGFRYLKEHSSLLKLSLFLTAINFLAKLGGDGMMAPFILGRTGNDQTILGMVQVCVSLGLLAGSTIVTVMKPPRNRTRAIFLLCGLTFLLGNAAISVLASHVGWCMAAFGAYTCASAMGVHFGTVMRTAIPVQLQGRVFSARTTLESLAIPLGIYLGGVLADKVFEPFMANRIPTGSFFHNIFGTGISLMFSIVGMVGLVICVVCFARNTAHDLNSSE